MHVLLFPGLEVRLLFCPDSEQFSRKKTGLNLPMEKMKAKKIGTACGHLEVFFLLKGIEPERALCF